MSPAPAAAPQPSDATAAPKLHQASIDITETIFDDGEDYSDIGCVEKCALGPRADGSFSAWNPVQLPFTHFAFRGRFTGKSAASSPLL